MRRNPYPTARSGGTRSPMTALTDKIAAKFGSLSVALRDLANPADRESYAIDGFIPAAVARPSTTEEAAEIVHFAVKNELAVVPVGGRTKLSIGATPARYDIALDMSAVSQISHYDPAD